MPTNRRQRPTRRRAELQALSLMQWLDLLSGDPYWDRFVDVDEFADAWDAHRERILPLWIERFPGTRPFAFWLCDAIPDHGERRIIDPAGAAQWTDSIRRRFGVLHTDTLPPIQESETDYLERNGLLTDAERAALDAGRGEVPTFPVDLARELAA